MPDFLVYILYALLAAAIAFLSIKLSDYVDMLDKTTKMSGAFIGGIFLAAVTSLPELFTSISSVTIIRENEMVAGNILGSNMFNLFALAVVLIFTVKKFSDKDTKINPTHYLTLLVTFIMYGLVTLAAYVPQLQCLGWLNVVSPIILALYIIFILKTPKDEAPTEKIEVKYTTKQIVLRFVICAIFLIAASIGITYISDMVAVRLNLGKTFAGALLLGVTTSLPELVSTISLCIKRNFNAAFGNIFGSNVFNFNILVVADLLSFQGSDTLIYTSNKQSLLLIIFGAVSLLAFTAVMLTKLLGQKKENTVAVPVLTSILSTIPISLYVVFLILSVM